MVECSEYKENVNRREGRKGRNSDCLVELDFSAEQEGKRGGLSEVSQN